MAILDRNLGLECKRATKKSRMNPTITLPTMAIAASSLVIILAAQAFLTTPSFLESPSTARITYASHAPIVIAGNEGFLGDSSSTGVTGGSGTEQDPYIIEGWDIIPDGWGRGIWVREASVHFIIQDCYIHDYSGGGILTAGIYIEWCHNATVRDNIVTDCGEKGIWIEGGHDEVYYSTNCSVIGNECSGNSQSGILVARTHGCVFSNNTCYGNPWGINIGVSHYDTVSNNTCTGSHHGMVFVMADNGVIIDNECSLNSGSGIIMDLSGNNTLANNTCSYNSLGIHLSYATWQGECDDNVIQSNWIEGNSGYGVLVGDGNTNNTIWNNTFVDNNGASETYDPDHVQAMDNGIVNWWNNSDGYGNYWSDWTTPDANSDGVVDVPYELAGTAATMDSFPRTTFPTVIPEFSSSAMVIGVTATMVTVFLALRRREKNP